MKHIVYILIIALCCSCNASKSGERNVTFVVEVPENTPENKKVFISGNFEGWSGGNEQFKLEPISGKHSITIRNHTNIIQYKFTLGSWEFVERNKDNIDIENRQYAFKKRHDTVYVKVETWAKIGSNSKASTSTKNVSILNDSLFIPQLNRYRTIRAYLPPQYQTSNKTYPVIYMQDGQNVFDLATSFAGEWQVDETLNRLYYDKGFEAIVIAIDNGGDHRMNEYSPYANKEVVKKPEGDAYLDFIVNTLKPYVDKTLRTKTDKEHTAIIGSSMGGLISHYAGIQYPEVFGKIGVFSSSFWISEKAFKLAKSKSKALNNMVYFVVGENEGGGMDKDTKRMAKLMIDNGFNPSNIESKIVKNGTHSEGFWRDQFKEAIQWLFAEAIAQSKPPKLTANKVEDAKLSNGTLMRVQDFPSKHVKSRPVDVWLPENYSKDKSYAVLYMHDGQMLFDATTTWNNQEWKVDEWASKLISTNKTKPFIVVGIHNISGSRWLNYYPEKALDFVPVKALEALFNGSENTYVRDMFNADDYLKFIIDEVKPFIDSNFATLKDKQQTFIAGSSMGGLISMYAVSEYPEVFGGAACLSTHWVGATPVDDNPLPDGFFKYMKKYIPESVNHKFYFDFGTKTLDAHYPQYEASVNTVFREKGYTEASFRNLKFEGADHSELSWQKRLDKPLIFLLGTE